MSQLMLIPAYFYPGTYPTLWTMMNSAPLNSIIVANVSSGPGASSDPVYVSAIAAAQAAGMRVVGYVNCPSGTSTPTVESEIDKWKLWYNVDGIFLDQVSGTTLDLTYYTTISAYIKGAPGGLVVMNCGAPPQSTYIGISDVVVILENTYKNFVTSYENPAYAAANSAKMAMILHDTDTTLAAAAVYQSIYYSAGIIYVTDGTGVNPYAGLPTYWTTLLSLIAAGASLGPVLQWTETFESYPVGVATITAPWTSPNNTRISNTIYQAGTQSLGVGVGGNGAYCERPFPIVDLGPVWTVDMWVYVVSGSTVNDPPVINAPILNMDGVSGAGQIQFLIGENGTYYIGDADASANQWFTGSVSANAWHRFTIGVTSQRVGGSAYLIVDGGSTSTYGPANTQTNGGYNTVQQFAATGQFVVGSPIAEAYIDNVSVYRGAFTPSSGGGAKPFAHMLPAGMVAEAAESLLIGPIPGIAAVAIGASAKVRRVLSSNPKSRRRDLLRRFLDG